MAITLSIISSTGVFRYTEEKFNVGMINSVEYNQSKNNLSSARSELLQAKYEYILRTKILDFYNRTPIDLQDLQKGYNSKPRMHLSSQGLFVQIPSVSKLC